MYHLENCSNQNHLPSFKLFSKRFISFNGATFEVEKIPRCILLSSTFTWEGGHPHSETTLLVRGVTPHS